MESILGWNHPSSKFVFNWNSKYTQYVSSVWNWNVWALIVLTFLPWLAAMWHLFTSGEPRQLSTIWLQTCSCIYSKRPLTKNVRNIPRSGKWLNPHCALKVNDRYLYWHDCWNDLLQESARWDRNQQKYFGVILRDAGDIITFEGCVMHIQCHYCVSVPCGCNVCVLWEACGDVSIVL